MSDYRVSCVAGFAWQTSAMQSGPDRLMRWGKAFTVSVAFLLAPGAVGFAQKGPVSQSGQPSAAEQSLPQPSQPQAVMPDAEKIVLLIRTALLTLNDALQTGNFTVLRDIGAPGFRDANSAASLSQNFSSLMSQGADLTAVAVMSPQLTEPPVLDPQSDMLQLKGIFPGNPVQINFTLVFQPIAGRWRLFGLSVNPSQAVAVPPAGVGSPAEPAKANPEKSAPKARSEEPNK